MELCTPEGMPMRSIRFKRPASRFPLSRSRKGPCSRMSLTVISRAATAWDRTVATATPATFQEKAMTNSTSSAMLRPQPMNRHRKGNRASPMERRMPEPMLNSSRNTAPIK